MCKTEKFQRNLSTIFLKLLNIYVFSKIFQKVEIVMLPWNILQYLKKMLREYFSCNERLEIFLTYFCSMLCYVESFAHSKIRQFLFLHNGLLSTICLNTPTFFSLFWYNFLDVVIDKLQIRLEKFWTIFLMPYRKFLDVEEFLTI